MQLSVHGKQIDVGDALRGHVGEKLKDITHKYFEGALDAHVTFSREANMFRADVTVHAGRDIVLQSHALADDAYIAFDAAADRMGGRLKRYRNRIKNHHDRADHKDAVMAGAFVLQPEQEEPADNPVIVAEMQTPIRVLTVSEAVMHFELGDGQALMFRNQAHGGLNMIYRRSDGHIGWVDPKGQ